MTQYDIWRTAHELIEVHCAKAAAYAARQEASARDTGDVEASQVWRRVLTEINRLRGT